MSVFRRFDAWPGRKVSRMIEFDACWSALVRRDPAADGVFFVAVKSTRIYCRPICAARTPLKRNVSFHASAAAAQAAGYRPCLRCRPETAPESPAWAGSLASINRALRLIDDGALQDGSVESLAGRLGMTGRHLRRLFEQHLGVGPLAVEQTRRINLAKALIHDTRLPLTAVAFASGFGSIRRFNEAFREVFGRSPTELRSAPEMGSGEEGVSLRLSSRPDPDWERRASGGRSLVVSLDELAPGAIAEVTPDGPRRLRARLQGTPVADMGRALALTKRKLFGELEPESALAA